MPAAKPKTSEVEAIEANATAPVGAVTGVLAGKEIQTLPVSQWRSSGRRAFKEEDFETWAEKTLTPASLVVWKEVDPTMDQVSAYVDSWSKVTGEDPKGS